MPSDARAQGEGETSASNEASSGGASAVGSQTGAATDVVPAESSPRDSKTATFATPSGSSPGDTQVATAEPATGGSTGDAVAPSQVASDEAASEPGASPHWVDRAREYNRQSGLVAQFNAATGNACGVGDDADPRKVSDWQVARGLKPDGCIGPDTLRAATGIPRAAAPIVSATPGDEKRTASADVEARQPETAVPHAEQLHPTSTSPAPAPRAAGPSATSATPRGTAPVSTESDGARGAPTSSATPAPAAARPSHRTELQSESTRLIKLFDAQQVDEGKAVQAFVAFDQRLGGGQMTQAGVEIMAKMITTMGEHELHRQQQAAASHRSPPGAPASVTAGHPVESRPAADRAAAPAVPSVAPGTGDNVTALAAGLPSPTISKIVTDLGALREDTGGKKRDARGEYAAKDRAKVIDDIAAIRLDLAGIDRAGLDPTRLGKFVALVNRELQELSVYHYQGLNIMTVETDIDGKGHFFSTCNLTSFAMSLELLGRSAKDYVGEKKPHLLLAAQHYKSDLVRKERGATRAEGDRSGSEASLLGIRLPDFLELALVAEFMNAATDAAAIEGGKAAATCKTDPTLLLKLARHFGVQGTMMHVDWNVGHGTKLAGADKALAGMSGRSAVENMERLRAHAATGDKQAQADYELAQKSVDLHAKDIDSTLPLDRYRDAAVAQLQPLLDSGAAVMAGCYAHWTRLISVDPDKVKVQDPGAWDRHEMAFPWVEARAMGYFWQNIVFR